MSEMVLFAAIGSIVATLLLTLVLWRINAPPRRDRGGDAGGGADAGAGRRAADADHDGDGGGDGGGGGD